jgi:hypothetical protein
MQVSGAFYRFQSDCSRAKTSRVSPIPQRRKLSTLAEAVAGVLAPVSQRRGFAVADLAAAWPEVVGARYADCTYPEKIDWPRAADKAAGGVLRMCVEGPRAVLVQHELGQLLERVNGYLGHGTIGRIRLVQGTVPRRKPPAPPPRAADEGKVAQAVAAVDDDALREALARLGRGIFAG